MTIYNTITHRSPIEKGWSGDEKYCATTADGTKYLLRVTTPQKSGRFRLGYQRMLEVASLGIPMCLPVEFGQCPEGTYAIHSWVDGNDARDVIPTLPISVQYAYGLDAGKILQKLHSLPAPADAPPWVTRYTQKIDRKIAMYKACPLKYENGDLFLAYLENNRHLLTERPQTYQHGDYHIGNMMIDKNGVLTIIDFDRDDFGDPWEEFNRIVWCAQESPAFASGMVDGYFDRHVPMEFWKLLALYICSNTLSSLPWAIPFGDVEIHTMRSQAAQVLSWYDNMQNPVPNWYRHVALARLADTDKDAVSAVLLNDQIKRTYMVPDLSSPEEADRLFLVLKELSRRDDHFVRGIIHNGELVGFLNDTEIMGSSIELGWVIHPRYHSRGFATQAVTLAIRELFGRGFTEVTAGAFEENPASIRVMEKCGMIPMGKTEVIEYRGKKHKCKFFHIEKQDR